MSQVKRVPPAGARAAGRGLRVCGLWHLALLLSMTRGASESGGSAPILVANADCPVSSISAADVKRLYTGDLAGLGGQKMVPVNLPLDSAIAAAFLERFIGMTPAEYKEFWVGKQAESGQVPPMIQRTAVNARMVIGQLPGGIGYMLPGDADGSVKVLEVSE